MGQKEAVRDDGEYMSQHEVARRADGRQEQQGRAACTFSTVYDTRLTGSLASFRLCHLYALYFTLYSGQFRFLYTLANYPVLLDTVARPVWQIMFCSVLRQKSARSAI